MKIFHHNDPDGCCAAYVAFAALDMPCELIEMDYRDKFPLDKISSGETVYILDFHISTEDMDKLLEITSDVVWIDHHKTAIDEYANYDKAIDGLRFDGYAGCVLTYLYFHAPKDSGLNDTSSIADVDPVVRAEIIEKLIPFYVRLVGDRDVWAFVYGDDTRNFHYGVMAEDYSPDGGLWARLASDGNTSYCAETYSVIDNGRSIRQYMAMSNKKSTDEFAYEIEFEGHKCLVLNTDRKSSETFGDEDEHDIKIIWNFDGKGYNVSIYAKDADVSEIAKKHGGGGHAKASGFICKQLPWDK